MGGFRRILFRYMIITLILNLCMAEIVSMTLLGAAVLTGGWYKWGIVKENTICRYMECCIPDHVPFDVEKLKSTLPKKLFGQPLVDELVNIIEAHKGAIYGKSKKNEKALVISLHGWSGVGKNYAVTMIAEALYQRGMKSNYVKLFMGKKDFDCTDLQDSKKKLITEVTNIVKMCPTSLIIFDEIHDMCPDVLDAIKPMLDHHHSVDGVDYRDSIFIFISNIGGQEIATTLLDLYGKGIKRKDVEFHNFEPTLRRVAFYTLSGLEKSSTIAHNLIDHYIPFLPLEQHHVEMCALAEFRAHGVYNPTEQMMSDALSIITYGPTEEQPIFANSGCKRLTKKIAYVIQKYQGKSEL